MYQFFVEPSQIQGTRVVITGNDVNHIKNVLRMQPGEEIAVSNGEDGKEYRCGIEELYEDEIVCTLRFIKEDGVELPSKIYLFHAVMNMLVHFKLCKSGNGMFGSNGMYIFFQTFKLFTSKTPKYTTDTFFEHILS